jgi:hypothetical protein
MAMASCSRITNPDLFSFAKNLKEKQKPLMQFLSQMFATGFQA